MNFLVKVSRGVCFPLCSVKEDDEAFADFKNATLRNKNVLQTENNKLSAEIEKVQTRFYLGKNFSENIKNNLYLWFYIS